MRAEIEVKIKFDDDKAKKLKLSINNVQSKWLKKDLRNMEKWQGLVFDALRREFPQAK